MKIDTQSASARGISSAYICEGVEEDIKKNVVAGKYRIVYFTPEKLLSKTWIRVLRNEVYQRRLKVMVFDRDEAHCIKNW